MGRIKTGKLMVLAIIFAIIFGPMLFIVVLNQLFPLEIAITLLNWFAALYLTLLLGIK